MDIITVHGIRTPVEGAWYKEFAELPIWKNADVNVHPFSYEYFSLRKFLTPRSRKKVLKKFTEFYSKHFPASSAPPSIVCHSFGTFIFFSAIKKFKVIKFDQVILCGSILNEDMDWAPYFQSGQINSLYNDYGSLDKVVNWSRYVIKDCGNSGEIGFTKVPESYESQFKQRKNYLEHGEYFLPLQMTKNWGSILNPKQFKFKNNILRQEIINRIYANIGLDQSSKKDLAEMKAKFTARIDIAGNYYASYSKEILNKGSEEVSFYDIRTTADSVIATDDMDFFAYDDDGKNLRTEVISDIVQSKIFRIHLDKEVKPNDYFRVNYKFNWKGTINCKAGDTDHFAINGVKHISINLNFKFKLSNTRFFYVSNNKIVKETVVKAKDETDGTYGYKLEFENENNYDGVIFYFDGKTDTNANTMKLQRPYKLKDFAPGKSASLIVEKCQPSDIRNIYRLEYDIELSNAASEATLKERLQMFNDGFLVARYGNEIVGYVESILWKDFDFRTFEEIKNFPLRYDVNGDTLYVIFIAVKADYRRKGVGSALLESIEWVANRYQAKRIKLVAKDDLIAFYQSVRYNGLKQLPDFLDNKNYKSLLMEKEI